jgi:hypothetical protein
MKIRYVILLSTLLLAGCVNPLTNLFVSKKAKESEIADLKKNYEKQIEIKTSQVSSAKDEVIASKDKQIVAGSNAFYAADLTFKTIKTPARTDIVTNNYVNEGWTALGKKTPDAETMIRINERLKNELDETKTSLNDLQNAHVAMITESQRLADNAIKFEIQLKAAEEETRKVKESYLKNIQQKQDELINLGDKIIFLEKERADNRAAIQATKEKLSMIAGAIALACLAGAIWSPVFKTQFATFGGVAAVASIGILYIQGWMILTFVGVIGIGLVLYAAYKHHNEEKLSDALVLGLQDIKNTSKDTWQSTVRPFIEERLKKYVSTSNGVKTVANKSLESQIDKKLIEWDAK